MASKQDIFFLVSIITISCCCFIITAANIINKNEPKYIPVFDFFILYCSAFGDMLLNIFFHDFVIYEKSDMINIMDGQIITQFLTDYGYWILLPLMIIEGPIVTLIAAFMASMGIFNIYIIFFLSVIGDILGDVFFYGLGRWQGMLFVQKVGRHIGITEALVRKMEKFFVNHGGKTIIAVKSTTGLCWATFIAAGIVKMPFFKFLGYSFVGGLIWSAFLVFMGYFFGSLYERIAEYINYAGIIIASLVVAFLIGINKLKKRKTKHMFDDEVVDKI